jgi:hypothetical protein
MLVGISDEDLGGYLNQRCVHIQCYMLHPYEPRRRGKRDHRSGQKQNSLQCASTRVLRTSLPVMEVGLPHLVHECEALS